MALAIIAATMLVSTGVVEALDKIQLTLPDIQLTDADQVFRLYIKSQHDKAVYMDPKNNLLLRVLLLRQ